VTTILLIALLPTLVAVLGLFPRLSSRLPKVAAALMALQVPLVIGLCLPVFDGATIEWGGFAVDGLSASFTCITTVVVAAAMIQAAILLPIEREDRPMSDRRFGLYYSLIGMFVVAMYAVPLAQNLGYMWIALEATTLMSAPLVDYHRSQTSLEATWKYLLLCSVGIAFALFGTILIFAAQHSIEIGGTLSIPKLLERAAQFDPRLLRVGFVFCLLGYGTKAGIFPLHNWLPDAHSEAPAPVSAMLSGALLNCALVAIWRISQIVSAAGQADLVGSLLVPAGAVTVLAASVMLIRQHDLKRMWAYSSVEHVGLMTVAIGIGAGPVFILHAANHSIVKTSLFLMSGDVLHAFGTKALARLSGILQLAPLWGIVLVGGAFAIAGSPPFGPFLSEWLLLKGTFGAGQVGAAIAILAGLTIAFLAITAHLVKAVLGEKPGKTHAKPVTSWAYVPAALLAVSLVAGVAVTPSAMELLKTLTARTGSASVLASTVPARLAFAPTPRGKGIARAVALRGEGGGPVDGSAAEAPLDASAVRSEATLLRLKRRLQWHPDIDAPVFQQAPKGRLKPSPGQRPIGVDTSDSDPSAAPAVEGCTRREQAREAPILAAKSRGETPLDASTARSGSSAEAQAKAGATLLRHLPGPPRSANPTPEGCQIHLRAARQEAQR
jgi:hydrogenase-4 component F